MECIELMIGEIENLKLDSLELSIMSLLNCVGALRSERDEQDYLCFSMILYKPTTFQFICTSEFLHQVYIK